jgi:formiminoglutamate deiminase
MTAYWAERALLPDGVARWVRVDVDDDGAIAAIETDVALADAPAVVLGGLVLPGLVDSHSHAFHRALRGRAVGGDFWAWRRGMYELVERLDPDRLEALAAAAFGELLLAGVTTVHEFHYLHESGMDDAVCEAARRAGIRLVLLDTCYLRAGFDEAPLDPVQQRFSDGDVDRWVDRAEGVVARNPDITIGAAVHSVRAVDPASMRVVAAWAREREVPVHLHLSEQPAENVACRAATGRSPAELADEHGVLGPSTVAVHATHVTAGDAALLGRSGTAVCLCPTTERDLGDGVGPAAALRDAGCPIRLGTDSHAVVDLFEEARAVELDERLVERRRGIHVPAALLRAAIAGAALRVGEPADLCTVDLQGVRLAGVDPDDPVPMVVASATSADVTDVIVGGRHVVQSRRHADLDVAAELRSAIAAVC